MINRILIRSKVVQIAYSYFLTKDKTVMEAEKELFFSFEKYPEYKTFLKNRFFQLVVPYLFFNIITYLFWLTVGRQFGKDALFDLDPLKPLLGILYGNATGHFLEHNVPLWFLACLFITENLYFLVFRKSDV